MDEKLVTVASFSTSSDAQLAGGRLEAAGITATVADDNTTRINRLFSNVVGEIKVRVFERDLPRARAVLGVKALEPEA